MAMPPTRPLLLFTFANDRVGDGAAYLRNLPEERRALQRVFPVGEQRQYDVHIDYNVTPDGLRALLDQHTDRIVGFHFGGHATTSGLGLETADGRPDVLRVAGFASELAGLPNLAFVFLNGCSTAEHVEAIRAACGGDGPVIVATEWAILDTTATRFAARFYRNLRLGRTLADAYRKAEAQQRGDIATPSMARAAALVDLRPEAVGSLELSYRFLRPAEKPVDGPNWPWALFPAPADPASVDWRLPSGASTVPWFRRATIAGLIATVVLVAIWATREPEARRDPLDAGVTLMPKVATDAQMAPTTATQRYVSGPAKRDATAPLQRDAQTAADGAATRQDSTAVNVALPPTVRDAARTSPVGATRTGSSPSGRRPTRARSQPAPVGPKPVMQEPMRAASPPDSGPAPGSLEHLEGLLPEPSR